MVRKLSRRRVLSGGGIALAVSALAACGGSAPEASPTLPVATLPAAAPTATTVPPTMAAAGAATAASPTSEVQAPTAVLPTVPPAPATAPAANTAPPTSAPEPTASAAAGPAYLAAVHGASPAAITEAAIQAIGGIERFVKQGDDVIVKPNMCVSYYGPEYAATTNPEVVATIVKLCKAAGAKRVRAMDFPWGGRAEDAYKTSGIQAAVEAAGGEMELMAHAKYKEVDFPPESRDIRHWLVYEDAVKADVIINVPIAKHHGSSVLTLGCKNLMGLIEQRNLIHVNLHQRIADLVTLFKPKLTVVDAVRILVANGPSGGDLNDVKKMDTVIASHDIVAADAYAVRFFPFADIEKVAYIKLAGDMGLGTYDLASVDVRELSI